MVKVNPAHPYVYTSAGFAYAKLRQYDKALASFTKAAELDANPFWPYSNRGWVYLVLNKCDEAKSDIERSITFGPRQPAGHVNLGSYFWSCNKDKGKALEEYEKAFKNGFSGYDTLYDKTDDGQFLKGLNDTPEFKALVDKYRRKKADKPSTPTAPAGKGS